MRKKTHGSSQSVGPSETAFEAGVKFGEFYSALEAHIDAFRKSEGSAFSLHEIRARVDRLLEAKEIREGILNPQLVPQMRQNGPGADQRGESGLRDYEQPANSHFHVQPRGGETLKRRKPTLDEVLALREQGLNRAEIGARFGWSASIIDRILRQKRQLSPEARAKIAAAQRRRWANPTHRKKRMRAMQQAIIERAKVHYAQTPAGRRQRAEAMRRRWARDRGKMQKLIERGAKNRRRGIASTISQSWREKFPTPEARSAEMKRRQAVARAKREQQD